jgi:predicted enzyme related to lactoylglutathione lyase
VPKRDVAPLGAPCWIDLFTSDPDRSRAFYGELFGWDSEAAGEEFGGYINFSKDGALVAGAMKNDGSSGSPDVWSIYLATKDAQASVDAAVANGGQVVVPPMQIADIGTMAVVTDVGGAAIGLWQPGTHQGFGVIDEPGTPGWFELHTRDYDKVVAFYRNAFGWDTHTAADEPGFRYTTKGEGENGQAGIYDAGASLPDGVPAFWSVYFRVEDTDASLANVLELGGVIHDPAQDTPYGRLATAGDPTGATFKLVSGGS